MNTDELIKRYTTSYFHDKTCAGWFDANDAAKETGRKDHPALINSRAIGGFQVPIPEARELVATMIQNVEDSRDDVRLTGERLQRAKRDGLLDKRAYQEEDGETQERWLAAINTVRGDYQRAVSEMKHWQGYAETASSGTLPVLKNSQGSGVLLIRQLADLKTFPPDPRLPPERDEDAA